MQPDWARIQELFDQALELPAADRRAFLEAQSPEPAVVKEVLELLAYDSRGLTHVNAAVGAAAREITGPAALPEGAAIGPWRVRRVLGQGGMGAVYEVERADGAYQQIAALKRIRSDAQSAEGLRRFLEERDILARLNHPNIARLLDGGTAADGQPYLVMEAVEGLPITEYVAAKKLTARQILTLFLDVCKGVQSAHNRLVIHRDLKPSNIHVTHDGHVKLLDFGIAKLLDPSRVDATLTGHLILTPEYASPEQVSGQDVSTASDIYSLGAVLFELLTGAKAHALTSTSPAEIVRVVLESELPKSNLPSELDTIVRAAMQKLPERRYASVDKLAEDIDRYLANRPLLARPDSLTYKTTKYLRRNWIAVAAAAIVAVSLVSAATISTIQARRAQKRFDEVRTLANTFLFDFHDKIRDLPGSTPAREMVVNTARKYLDRLATEAAGDTNLQLELAAAYDRLGDVLGSQTTASLGRTKDALAAYRAAFQLRESLEKSNPSNPAIYSALTDSYNRLGDAEKLAGTMQAAMPLWRESARRARAANSPLQEFDALLDIATGAQRLSDPDTSIETMRRAIALVDAHPAIWPNGPERARTSAQARLVVALIDKGHYAEARDLAREALTVTRQMLEKLPDSNYWLRQSLVLNSYLGDILNSSFSELTTSPAEALQPLRDSLAFARRLHEIDPASVLAFRDVLYSEARLAEAEASHRDPRALDTFDALIASYNTLIEKDPLDADTRRRRASISIAAGVAAAEMNQGPRALRLLSQAITLTEEITQSDPGRMPRSEIIQLYSFHGRAAKSAASLSRCRQLALAIPVANANLAELIDSARCFNFSSEQTPNRQYLQEALTRWQAAIDRPTPGQFLRTQRDKTAAALQRLP
jgi:serine/threonine protein kinase/tetratricopeptide (TPR) repeat protein